MRIPLGPGVDTEIAIGELWGRGTEGIEERADELRATFVDSNVAQAAIDAVGAGELLGPSRPDLDAWRAYSTAWTAGRFVLRPPWVDGAGPARSTSAAGRAGVPIELVIDPGHAFGSGSHVTTRLVLDVISELVEPDHAVLDVGCGSGVLSVAAARLGARSVAVDIDPAAREATRANAARNDVGDAIEVIDALPSDAGFDVVVANVPVGVHEELAGPINELCAPTARLVLTGVLVGQQAAATLAAYGRTIISEHTEDGWARLVARP